jgi:hypothetical protein
MRRFKITQQPGTFIARLRFTCGSWPLSALRNPTEAGCSPLPGPRVSVLAPVLSEQGKETDKEAKNSKQQGPYALLVSAARAPATDVAADDRPQKGQKATMRRPHDQRESCGARSAKQGNRDVSECSESLPDPPHDDGDPHEPLRQSTD